MAAEFPNPSNFSKNQVLKLVAQVLENYGLNETYESLMNEAGLPIVPNWQKSVVSELNFPEKSQDAHRAIAAQKYHEMLEEGETDNAVDFLRENLTEMCQSSTQVADLALKLIFPGNVVREMAFASAENPLRAKISAIGDERREFVVGIETISEFLKHRNNTVPLSSSSNASDTSSKQSPPPSIPEDSGIVREKQPEIEDRIIEQRRALVRYIETVLPTEMVTPPDRFFTLMTQAMRFQDSKCKHHRPKPEEPGHCYDLFVDHTCGPPDPLPVQLAVLEFHADEVWFICFSPNGAMLASSSPDKVVAIWKMPTVATSSGSPQRSNGETSAVDQEAMRLMVKNMSWKPHFVLKGHSRSATHLVWSPDSRYLLYCADDIWIWDSANGSVRMLVARGATGISSACWIGSSHNIASVAKEKLVKIHNIAGRELFSIALPQLGHDVICGPPESGYLIISNPSGKIMTCPIPRGFWSSSLTDHDLRFTDDLPSPSVVFSTPNHECITCLIRSDVHPFEVLLSLDNQQLWLFSLVSHTVLRTFSGHRQQRYVVRMAFIGQYEHIVASGSEDGKIVMWNRATGDIIGKMTGHSSTTNAVSYNRFSNIIASASDDKAIVLWSS